MTKRSLTVLTYALCVAVLSVAGMGFAIGQERLPWQNRPAPSAEPPAKLGADDTYRPGVTYGNEAQYAGGGDTVEGYDRNRDVYVPDPDDSVTDTDRYRPGDSYRSNRNSPPPSDYGYGEPYAPPSDQPPPGRAYRSPDDPDYGRGRADVQPPVNSDYYEEGEIISAGHSFFGSISQGLAKAVEYAFSKQGRPNGYILGEDAGGAFVLGLRYGEGQLHTKDAGSHKVYWQGPSLGYDAGAEGSKTMVLVYNMSDVSEIYRRFGGVQGSIYVIGGVSVQFQKHDDVTLAVIRSGVGLRVGANVGYLKYTRQPTWNPL